MNAIIYFFGSGLAFFVGVAFVFLALAIAGTLARAWCRTVSELLTVVGGLLIAASATPLPLWFYVLAAMLTFGWLVAERVRRTRLFRRYRLWWVGVIAVGVLGLGLELPYHFLPSIPQTPNRHLCIIGDSISAGTGELSIETWPRVFARQHSWTVDDRSKMGATVRSIRKLAEAQPRDDGVILLEIGGNDLLGDTTLQEYERGLEELLRAVCGANRTLVMFELPLPPLMNGFGQVQRRLAKTYGVILIPKRVLLDVLTTDGATIDGIHLSIDGHQQMASRVAELIGAD